MSNGCLWWRGGCWDGTHGALAASGEDAACRPDRIRRHFRALPGAQFGVEELAKRGLVALRSLGCGDPARSGDRNHGKNGQTG